MQARAIADRRFSFLIFDFQFLIGGGNCMQIHLCGFGWFGEDALKRSDGVTEQWSAGRLRNGF